MNLSSPTELATDLLNRHAELIDEDRLEEWVELFTDESTYRIVPRENHDRGLPVSIIVCANKRMIRDRIVSLRNANEYNLHYDRHLISGIRAGVLADGSYQIAANYAVFQTTMGGESRLFSVGRYRDKAVLREDRLLFTEKLVIVDTFSVPTLLATPL